MEYIVSYLLIIFSGFYLFHFFVISPVYIIVFLGIAWWIIKVMKNWRNTEISLFELYIMSIIFYFALDQYAVKGVFNTSFSFIISLIYLIIIIQLYKQKNIETIYKASYIYIVFSIGLISIDTLYRLSHPSYYFNVDSQENLAFYIYKINSILFQDSNFVGLYCVVLFSLTLFLNVYNKKKINIVILSILFILTIFTFSRASIISCVCVSLIYFLFYFKKAIHMKVLTLIILAGTILILFYNYFNFFSAGKSFNSKFIIMQKYIEFSNSSSIFKFLFGVGFGNSFKFFGMGAHDFFITFLMETGLLGLILMLSVYIILIFISKGKLSLIIIPFIINGFSLTSDALTYLFSALIMSYFIYRIKERGKYEKV